MYEIELPIIDPEADFSANLLSPESWQTFSLTNDPANFALSSDFLQTFASLGFMYKVEVVVTRDGDDTYGEGVTS